MISAHAVRQHLVHCVQRRISQSVSATLVVFTLLKPLRKLSVKISNMDQENKKRVFLLLLKNLKQALGVLEVFEDDKKFNSHSKALMFEFDDTIKQAEELINEDK